MSIWLSESWLDASDTSCQVAGQIFYTWTQMGHLVYCRNIWCPSANNPIDNDWAYRLTLGDIQAVAFDE